VGTSGSFIPADGLGKVPRGIGARVSAILSVVGLTAMVLIPLAESLGRRTSWFFIPGAALWVQHLTLWIGLLGAILASYGGRHLSIAMAELIRNRRVRSVLEVLSTSGTVGILLVLVWASSHLVVSQTASPETIGGWFPVWAAQLAMPLAFLMMAIGRLYRTWSGLKSFLLVVGLALLLGPALALVPEMLRGWLALPGMVLIVLLAIVGMPLYAVLGGAGLLLFFAGGVTTAAVPAETYRIVTQPVLPSIPLFALAGVVLASGGAPRRLIRLVQAWTGWLPGGAAIATVVGCAVFTAKTGASGVTILALGALLFPVLMTAHRDERFSLGLLTASGSIGLLFPPSLPVILYGVYGRVAIDRLFVAALVPGLLLLLVVILYSLFAVRSPGRVHSRFDLREALAATVGAWADLLLPVLVLVGLFGGFMTLVEVAALAALWALVLETVIHRELDLRRRLPGAMVETSLLVGALLAVLGLALGLVSWLVDAQVPLAVADWVTVHIGSKFLFLLILNVLLLVVGALMDIFSAIVITVPLILPAAQAFGIDLAHLGVIFLANLELGHLTPPVGMNLFLASLRFEKPIVEVLKASAPFILIFAVWVLLITYLPALSVGVADLLMH
jgi:C4-dicarboxylate transporter DctM subunit